MALSVSFSLAYWSESINDALNTTETSIKIGKWTHNKTNDGSITYPDDFVVINHTNLSDKYPVSGVYIEVNGQPGVNIKEFDVLVFYYKELDTYVVLSDPKICGPYQFGGEGCPDIRKVNADTNKYRSKDIRYIKNIRYSINDIVAYNDKLYLSRWSNAYQHLPGTNESWIELSGNALLDRTYNPSKEYKLNENIYSTIADTVVYNGNVYIAIRAGKLGIPGEINSGWNLYGSLDYVENNTYTKNDIVRYNGMFYRKLAGNTTGVSPVDDNIHWKLANKP